MDFMTHDEIAKYIEKKCVWIRAGWTEATLEDYYKTVDDFASFLINNPPEEL